LSGPEIRSFQFGNDNVNLFRGDVNTSFTLVTLPFRNNLDVAVTLFYQSNIHEQAHLWNLDAPTGVLGLGWSMSYERIELEKQFSASDSTNSYFLSIGDNKSPLLRSDENWYLFDMSIELVKCLKEGKINTKIREIFTDNSFLLSDNCHVSNYKKDVWIIDDDENETTFKIVASNNILEVYDGGISFELKNYQFWKISYYPSYQRWLIIKENGVRSSYGGIKSQY